MMARVVRWGLFIVIAAGAATGPGCGSGAVPGDASSDEVFQNASLGEVGSLIETYIADANKPPAKLEDVLKYETGLPVGVQEVRSGNIVVVWGTPLSSTDTGSVLAYEKAVPQSGGFVLMADGKTIRKMSADEFKSAPKAGGAR